MYCAVTFHAKGVLDIASLTTWIMSSLLHSNTGQQKLFIYIYFLWNWWASHVLLRYWRSRSDLKPHKLSFPWQQPKYNSTCIMQWHTMPKVYLTLLCSPRDSCHHYCLATLVNKSYSSTSISQGIDGQRHIGLRYWQSWRDSTPNKLRFPLQP